MTESGRPSPVTGPQRTAVSRRVTMRDVAKLAKVSQSTVSRVLSPTPQAIPIGEETRQRVLEAVETLGYYPNLHAGSLRGQKTRMLAMLIADISNPFYHTMARAVQDVAHAHRYDVMVANSDHDRENELLFCESIIRRPVDGIIMVPYRISNEEIEQLWVKTGAAIAVLGSHITHPNVDVVGVNDVKATYELTSWLVNERHHTRIGYIGVTSQFAVGVRRHAAYVHALTDAGLVVTPDYFQEGDWSVESGERAMARLLALPQSPTAVVACNDQMAIGAMLTAEERGLRIPDDIAIVGFDDIPAASWVRPRLTTVAQPATAIGQYLAEAVFDRIEGVVTEQRQPHQIPCQLIIRESA
ncbi:MAG: LacI family DNA-binding transcriptional regulator [Caldilineaceae bacterium]|nr:LacI family DNA-binding transcriptional regulator [Caldilineaceae bacterium]